MMLAFATGFDDEEVSSQTDKFKRNCFRLKFSSCRVTFGLRTAQDESKINDSLVEIR